MWLELKAYKGGISLAPEGSHLYWTCIPLIQYQAVVKLHGVFSSYYGYRASLLEMQFRRVLRWDSAQVVKPFMQVVTYTTRSFATLGRL